MAGLLVAVLLVLVIVLVLLYCYKKRNSSKYDVSKASHVEMGTRTPSKPVLGGMNDDVIHSLFSIIIDSILLQFQTTEFFITTRHRTRTIWDWRLGNG